MISFSRNLDSQFVRCKRNLRITIIIFFLFSFLFSLLSCVLGYEMPVYTIEYHANGGSGNMEKSAHELGKARKLNKNAFSRSGYTFVGWSKTRDGEAKYADEQRVTDLTKERMAVVALYAVWDQVATSIEMVRINAGTYTRGSSNSLDWNASPPHQVTLTKSFYMGKYQVTQEQYQAVTGSNPSWFSSSPAAGETQNKRPVESVSWYDVIVFCNKLSMKEGLTPAYRISGSTDPAAWGTGYYNATWDAAEIVAGSTGYRLPTEAEWEYACRAGTTTAYNTGNTIADNTGWYWDNSGSKTHEVGKKLPNAWGLYDMHGNVYEWCWDWYGSYASGAQIDPTGASSGSNRVIRGGSWGSDGQFLRSAHRRNYYPVDRYIGFRLVRTITTSNAASYTVSYNINSGTGTTPTAQTVNAGNSVTLASGSGFLRSGYIFGGWNTNASGTGTNYTAGTSYTPTASTTLYAKWNTISVQNNLGSDKDNKPISIIDFDTDYRDITFGVALAPDGTLSYTISNRAPATLDFYIILKFADFDGETYDLTAFDYFEFDLTADSYASLTLINDLCVSFRNGKPDFDWVGSRFFNNNLRQQVDALGGTLVPNQWITVRIPIKETDMGYGTAWATRMPAVAQVQIWFSYSDRPAGNSADKIYIKNLTFGKN